MEDFLYWTLLIGGAWVIITSWFMLDYLISKYWPWGRKMEDERHELWVKQFLVAFDKNKGKRQRISDMKVAYLEHLKSLFADYIVETMLDVDKDASEVNRELDRLGNLLDLPDLIPKSQEALKRRIEARRASGMHKPVPLPDLASKEKVNYARINPDPIARRRNRWLTSLRSLLRTKELWHRKASSE